MLKGTGNALSRSQCQTAKYVKGLEAWFLQATWTRSWSFIGFTVRFSDTSAVKHISVYYSRFARNRNARGIRAQHLSSSMLLWQDAFQAVVILSKKSSPIRGRVICWSYHGIVMAERLQWLSWESDHVAFVCTSTISHVDGLGKFEHAFSLMQTSELSQR